MRESIYRSNAYTPVPRSIVIMCWRERVMREYMDPLSVYTTVPLSILIMERGIK